MKELDTFYFSDGALDGEINFFSDEKQEEFEYRFQLWDGAGDAMVNMDFKEEISYRQLEKTYEWLEDLLSGKREIGIDGIGWGRLDFMLQDEEMQVVDMIAFLKVADVYDGGGTYLRMELYGESVEEFRECLGRICKKEENSDTEERTELIKEIHWYCEQLDMELPKGFPEKMSNEEMQSWIECWSEFNPLGVWD